YNVKMTYTDNGGQNWIPTFAINNPPIRCFGTDIDVNHNGEVLVCWAVIPTDVASPYEIYIGFAISSNGGSSWIVQEKAIPTRGITGILSQKQNIRVNSTPRIAVDNSNSQYNGNIYIVTSQKELAPAGNDPDIVLFKSTDNGSTWSQGIRVNQDAFNNGKIQFFPSIHIDPFGGINILYLDDRNTTSDSTGVFLSRSMDGSETWSDYQVSDHNFQPIAVSGLGAGNVSDHIDITYTNGKLWPVWMDNSTGVYQVWTAPIVIPPVSVEDDFQSAIDYKLHQNYPNPFNPNTTISWQLAVSSHILIKLYDVLGNEVAILADDYFTQGKHQINFDSSKLNKDFSSGIYFYRLTADNFSETKSMVLIK
ncbi:MAG: T9SS type A sorting domain-containing protein, partial [Ignavibacteriaceae bacterium]|nr:T9SS type A sorting domain-containing protein [Ignavibacteriaceae bacterium]